MPAVQLLAVRHAEIEADFQRYYQIYLGDLFAGGLTLRRFSVLLYGLPPGSATWRTQGGPLARSDETQAALMVMHAVQTFQSSFAKKPKEVPFPDPPEWGHVEKAEEKATAMSRRMAKFLDRQKQVK